MAGWTLPMQFDIRVVEVGSPLSDDFRSLLEPVSSTATAWDDAGAVGATFDTPPDIGFETNPVAAGIMPLRPALSGRFAGVLLDPAQNNIFRVLNAVWEHGGEVRFIPGTAGEGSHPGESGMYLSTGLSESVQNGLLVDYAIVGHRGAPEGIALPKPRIGLYDPWGGSMDAGWTRWVLDIYGFDYTVIRPGDVRAGSLGERFDVIILSDIRSGQILNGMAKGSIPERYVGGIGTSGVRAIDTFVHEGGTLVCMNGSCAFAIDELDLPVRDVTGDAPRGELFLSSSILAAVADPHHPVMAGMPANAKIFAGRSPVFTTEEGFRGSAILKYEDSRSPLLSGYLMGDEHIRGYAAALDVHVGGGHVVLLGFQPQWRGQPFGTFRVLMNAALYHGQVAATATGSPGFWSPPEKEEK
ncbi:hypothetical protein ACFL39_02385 [Gemmatimonadota bacterium]